MLGTTGKEKVREYVKEGGGYIGICAGAFLGSSTFDWGLSLVNVGSQTGTHYVPQLGYQSWLDRGRGDVTIKLTSAGKSILKRADERALVQYTGGPIFRPGKRTFLSGYISLAHYSTEVSRHLFQKETMKGAPAIVAAPYGNGKVILIGPHPEAMPNLNSLMMAAIKAAAK